MKIKSTFFILSVLIAAVAFTGCSSSGSGSATAARAKVTTGVISKISTPAASPARAAAGSSSIVVNGITFTKKADLAGHDVTTFKFDGQTHPETDLKPGMIVTVKGSVDSATNTGSFESIEFKPDLRGPVGTVVSSSSTTLTLQVMGHEVVADANTKLEGVASLTDLNSLMTGTSIGKHPELEISGRMDSAGVVHATRISLESGDFGSGGMVEIHGAIDAVNTDGFTINGITVLITDPNILSHLTITGMQPGDVVEVKGNLTGTTLTATEVEGKNGLSDSFEVEDDISIQGIAAGALDAGNTFILNTPDGPVTVKCTDATKFRGGASLASIITADATLEVEGTLQADGSLLALEVKSESEIESESEGHSGSDGSGETESDTHTDTSTGS